MTLPQINLYSHGTQWTVSHGHFAFWGAYACGVISVIYLALQKVRGPQALGGSLWKWSFALLNVGLIGMIGATYALWDSGIDDAHDGRVREGPD
jgi:nitric oxide reductase subunit B